MLSEMTAGELAEWFAYSELEPFGPLHDSRRAAMVALATLAPWQDKGKEATAEDLFPELREQAKDDGRQWFTGEDMILAGRAIAAAWAGR